MFSIFNKSSHDEKDSPAVVVPQTDAVSGLELQGVVDKLQLWIDAKLEDVANNSRDEISACEGRISRLIEHEKKSHMMLVGRTRKDVEKMDELRKSLEQQREEFTELAGARMGLAIQEATAKEKKETVAALTSIHMDLASLREQTRKLQGAHSTLKDELPGKIQIQIKEQLSQQEGSDCQSLEMRMSAVELLTKRLSTDVDTRHADVKRLETAHVQCHADVDLTKEELAKCEQQRVQMSREIAEIKTRTHDIHDAATNIYTSQVDGIKACISKVEADCHTAIKANIEECREMFRQATKQTPQNAGWQERTIDSGITDNSCMELRRDVTDLRQAFSQYETELETLRRALQARSFSHQEEMKEDKSAIQEMLDAARKKSQSEEMRLASNVEDVLLRCSELVGQCDEMKRTVQQTSETSQNRYEEAMRKASPGSRATRGSSWFQW